jgi:endonuclease/exonuclease/phosphatase (EEP) superfamily protein YafD
VPVQVAQVPPFTPQLLADRARHWPLESQQPWQLVALQVVLWLMHAPCWQPWPVVQTWQVAAPRPQAPTSEPGWQVPDESQQPEQLEG